MDVQSAGIIDSGASGAELANIINEAALRAVRMGHNRVKQEDLMESVEVILAGYQRKGAVISPEEKKIIAYHEVGHALVAAKQKNSAPVQKITIIPRTSGALGYTLQVDEGEKSLMSKEELFNKIATFTGGRVAEELKFGSITTGASNDIEQATRLARGMITRFGMSEEFGMMALGSVRNQYLDGGYGLDCAQETAARMDKAVKDLLDQCYGAAVALLRDNLEDMHKVVAYLLEKETITGGEMVAIIEGRDPTQVEDAYASTRKAQKAFRPSQPDQIEAPAKHIHIVSEEIKAPIPLEEPEEPAESEETPAEEDSADGGEAPEPSASASEEPVRNEDAVPTEEDPSDTKPKA